MKVLNAVLVFAVLACGVAAYHHLLARESLQQSAAPKPQASATPAAPWNPNQEINSHYVKQLSERIAGHENERAERVFKNIQLPLFKGTPARRLLLIMNLGYSRALGVACTHCHVEEDFASDDKRPKRAAREMAVMHKMIVQQLRKMQNLARKPEERAINCSTCHRGAIDPMANPW